MNHESVLVKHKEDILEFKTLQPTPEKLVQLTTLCAASFKFLHPIYKKMDTPLDEVHEVLRQRINYAAEYGTIYVMEVQRTGEIALVATQFDLRIYMDKFQLKGNMPWLSIINNAGKELEEEYFKNLNPEPGVCIYGDIGAVKMEYANKKNNELFWNLACNEIKNGGHKWFFGRGSNPISTKIFCEYFGAKVVNRAYLKGQGMESQFMDLYKLDLQKMPAPGTRCKL